MRAEFEGVFDPAEEEASLEARDPLRDSPSMLLTLHPLGSGNPAAFVVIETAPVV